MGSSWRYRHVPITPYSIEGFHVFARTFFKGLLVIFHRLAFGFNGRAREFTRRWKTTGSHGSKQKNKSAQLAGPTFSQHFSTQMSPQYIQLDPIYYGYDKKSHLALRNLAKLVFWSVLSFKIWKVNTWLVIVISGEVGNILHIFRSYCLQWFYCMHFHCTSSLHICSVCIGLVCVEPR